MPEIVARTGTPVATLTKAVTQDCRDDKCRLQIGETVTIDPEYEYDRNGCLVASRDLRFKTEVRCNYCHRVWNVKHHGEWVEVAELYKGGAF